MKKLLCQAFEILTVLLFVAILKYLEREQVLKQALKISEIHSCLLRPCENWK